MSEYYPRKLIKKLKDNSFKGKALIIVGPRQSGKTTIIDKLGEYYESEKIKTLKLNCDNPTDRNFLEDKDLDQLKKIIGNNKVIFIDEAQKVKTIGQTLKLIVDEYKDTVQIYATGSSSFNLLESTEEPLTGRKFVYELKPISLKEVFEYKGALNIRKELKDYLIFGMYPEVLKQDSYKEKIEILNELKTSNLYKDILEFQSIRNPSILDKLLRALALQIGNEVSYTELSSLLGIDKNTVERYIDLLEKCYIIFRLSPYVQNKRREISKLRKVYFYDLGIRNSIINNFTEMDLRDDLGNIFENFVLVERMKYRNHESILLNQYFWRTYDGSEIDLVEEKDGKLKGYEFKWNKKKRVKEPAKWLEYPNSSFELINKETLEGFIY